MSTFVKEIYRNTLSQKPSSYWLSERIMPTVITAVITKDRIKITEKNSEYNQPTLSLF